MELQQLIDEWMDGSTAQLLEQWMPPEGSHGCEPAERRGDTASTDGELANCHTAAEHIHDLTCGKSRR